MNTITCPKCGKTLQSRGAHMHIKSCDGTLKLSKNGHDSIVDRYTSLQTQIGQCMEELKAEKQRLLEQAQAIDNIIASNTPPVTVIS